MAKKMIKKQKAEVLRHLDRKGNKYIFAPCVPLAPILQIDLLDEMKKDLKRTTARALKAYKKAKKND